MTPDEYQQQYEEFREKMESFYDALSIPIEMRAFLRTIGIQQFEAAYKESHHKEWIKKPHWEWKERVEDYSFWHGRTREEFRPSEI